MLQTKISGSWQLTNFISEDRKLQRWIKCGPVLMEFFVCPRTQICALKCLFTEISIFESGREVGRHGASRDVIFKWTLAGKPYQVECPLAPFLLFSGLKPIKLPALVPQLKRGKNPRIQNGPHQHQNGILPTTQLCPPHLGYDSRL